MQSKNRSKKPLSNVEFERREEQRRKELLSRDDIQNDYNLTRRWLELAALSGNGPPMVRISSRMIRYQRGVFEDWLEARTVASTSSSLEAA